MKTSIENRTLAFNKARISNLGTEFTRTQLFELLHKEGFNSAVFNEIVRQGLVEKIKLGGRNKCLYKFTETPIHKSKLKLVYSKVNSSQHGKLTEEGAIDFLKELGYKISKPVGINYKALEEENPELVEKYTEWKFI